MTDRIAKLKARDKAMRQSRDKVLRRIAQHLTTIGFAKAGSGHFVRESNDKTDHVGFQKHSSGRDVRVMAHIVLNDSTGTIIGGPWSDAYTRPNSPNGIRYNFGWTTNDEDIARCADEFCRFVDDVLITWFANPIPPSEKA